MKISSWAIGALFLFLLCFPKGGIKIADIPITWGYLLLLLVGVVCCLLRPLSCLRKGLFCYLAILPFQVLALTTFLFQGSLHMGYTFSLVLHFLIVPWIFLVIFPQYLNCIALQKIFSWIKQGLLFTASFGIFLFFYKFFTGNFFEIPLLTINYHDRNELELLKCIDRGGIFKLISTYNNGNLYGLCTLMLLPLYQSLKPKFTALMLIKISLILTLSRTVWAGLIVYELGMLLVSSTTPLSKKLLRLLSALVMLSGSLVALARIFPISIDFVFDRFLGNRIGQFEVLKNIEWIATKPFEGVYEIIYLGILTSFGVWGLIAFLIAMLLPLALYWMTPQKHPLSSAVALGLILYLFMACGDGALLLIPVMSFYWFLVALLITAPIDHLIVIHSDQRQQPTPLPTPYRG